MSSFALVPLVRKSPIHPIITMITASTATTRNRAPAGANAFAVAHSNSAAATLAITCALNNATVGKISCDRLDNAIRVPTKRASTAVAVAPLSSDLVRNSRAMMLALTGTTSCSLKTTDTAIIVHSTIPAITVCSVRNRSRVSPFGNRQIDADNVMATVSAGNDQNFCLRSPANSNGVTASSTVFIFINGTPVAIRINSTMSIANAISRFAPNNLTDHGLSAARVDNGPVVSILSSNGPLPTTAVVNRNKQIPPATGVSSSTFNDFSPVASNVSFFRSLRKVLMATRSFQIVSTAGSFNRVFKIVSGNIKTANLDSHNALGVDPSSFGPRHIRLRFSDNIHGFTFPLIGINSGLNGIAKIINCNFNDCRVIIARSFAGRVAPNNLTPRIDALAHNNRRLLITACGILGLSPGSGSNSHSVTSNHFTTVTRRVVNGLGQPSVVTLRRIRSGDNSAGSKIATTSRALRALISTVTTTNNPACTFLSGPFVAGGTDNNRPNTGVHATCLCSPDQMDFIRNSLTAVNKRKTNRTFTKTHLPLVTDFRFGNRAIALIGGRFSSGNNDTPVLNARRPFRTHRRSPAIGNSLSRQRTRSLTIRGCIGNLLKAGPSTGIIILNSLGRFRFISPIHSLTTGANLAGLVRALPSGRHCAFVFRNGSRALSRVLIDNKLTAKTRISVIGIGIRFTTAPRQTDSRSPILTEFHFTPTFGSVANAGNQSILINATNGSHVFTDRNPSIVAANNNHSRVICARAGRANSAVASFRIKTSRLIFASLLTDINCNNAGPLTSNAVRLHGLNGDKHARLSLRLRHDNNKHGRFAGFVAFRKMSTTTLGGPRGFLFWTDSESLGPSSPARPLLPAVNKKRLREVGTPLRA